MLVRSVPIKIEVNDIIVDTIDLYKQGLQYCIDNAWELGINNNVRLHPFVYSELRKLGLPAQLSASCIKMACGIVKKAKSIPFINKVSIRYNAPRSFSFKDNVLSISTINGRVKIPINIPDYARKYFNDWKIVESLLYQNKNKSYFTFTFSQESPETSNQHYEVLGVDLGVNNLAVTSKNVFYGNKIKSLRKRRDRLVSKLQSKGTRGSKRKLKKLSGTWQRFMRWTNHNISFSIVSKLKQGDIIVMEDLSGIRISARYNKWVHKWAFRQLQGFIEYKALTKGIRVVYVNPRYTSKSCSICHNIETIRHRGFIECKICGHCSDSDFGASKNIAQLYQRNMCRATVNTPVVLTSDDSVLNV